MLTTKEKLHVSALVFVQLIGLSVGELWILPFLLILFVNNLLFDLRASLHDVDKKLSTELQTTALR